MLRHEHVISIFVAYYIDVYLTKTCLIIYYKLGAITLEDDYSVFT